MYQILDAFLRPDELHCLRGDFATQIHWHRPGNRPYFESLHYRVGSTALAAAAAEAAGVSVGALRRVTLVDLPPGGSIPTRQDTRSTSVRVVEAIVQLPAVGGHWVVHNGQTFEPVALACRQAVVYDPTALRFGLSEVEQGRWGSIRLVFAV